MTPELIRKIAFKTWQDFVAELLKISRVETFDACSIAFFCKVLRHTNADEGSRSFMAGKIVDQILIFVEYIFVFL